METAKVSGKQIAAIVLLIVGLVSLVFGVLGLVGSGGKDPYDVRKSVVMVYSYLQLTDGQSANAMGTGFAIGEPGQPVEYVVTNGHVVEYGYMGPRVYAEQASAAGVQVYFSAAENDYVNHAGEKAELQRNSAAVRDQQPSPDSGLGTDLLDRRTGRLHGGTAWPWK